MREFGMLLTAVSMIAGSPALAQSRDLQAKPGKIYHHKATGVELAPTMAGLERTAVTAFVGTETDVGVNYWSADGSENITIFLYRNVSGSVPVWFDRARTTVALMNDKYRNSRSLGTRAFRPRGQARDTGLMEMFSTESAFRSTGVILFPVNGFYIKIRASSKLRDAAGLEQMLLSGVNSIDWSSRVQDTAATPVQDCATRLPARDLATVATSTEQERMMLALVGGVVAQAGALKRAAPTTISFCREPGTPSVVFGIYRPDASPERYMMALRDAGRAVIVGSSDLTQILSEMKSTPRVSVSLVDMERTDTFGAYQSLPLPDQALEMVGKTAPLSVATTWGDKQRNLTINTGK